MKIDEMPAGREMDALVAEKVFGWVRGSDFLVPPPGDHRWTWAARWDEDGLPHWLPDYSTNVSAAWKITEKIGRTWDIHWNDSACEWFVNLDHNKVVYEACEFNASDFDVAVAICRAALKAVGIEEV